MGNAVQMGWQKCSGCSREPRTGPGPGGWAVERCLTRSLSFLSRKISTHKIISIRLVQNECARAK